MQQLLLRSAIEFRHVGHVMSQETSWAWDAEVILLMCLASLLTCPGTTTAVPAKKSSLLTAVPCVSPPPPPLLLLLCRAAPGGSAAGVSVLAQLYGATRIEARLARYLQVRFFEALWLRIQTFFDMHRQAAVDWSTGVTYSCDTYPALRRVAPTWYKDLEGVGALFYTTG
jgi:hypothetical protein